MLNSLQKLYRPLKRIQAVSLLMMSAHPEDEASDQWTGIQASLGDLINESAEMAMELLEGQLDEETT